MPQITVFTDKGKPLTELQKKWIKEIMEQSHCPNESFHSTMPERYKGMSPDSTKIYMDGSTVTTEEQCDSEVITYNEDDTMKDPGTDAPESQEPTEE